MTKARARLCDLSLSGLAILFACLPLSAQEPLPASAAPTLQEELIAEIDANTPETVFKLVSADRKRVAHPSKRGKKWAMVVGGKAGPEYDEVTFPAFSSDNEHFSYAARRGKKWVIVRDGQESAPYDNVGRPVYSPDGQRLAYAAKTGKKWRMHVDGEPTGPEYDLPWQPFFSRDGKRVVYLAYINKTGWMVQGVEEPGPGFDSIAGLTLSADGRRYAYAGAKVKGGWTSKTVGTVVIDGKEAVTVEGAAPRERPKGLGGLLAEAAFVGGPFFEGGTFIVDYRGTHAMEVSPGGAGVSAPVFSPDGKRVVYAVRRGKDEEVMMVNEEAGAAFEAILTLPVFTSDGELMAYLAAEKGAKEAVVEVVNGEVLRKVAVGSYNSAEKVTFSPDGSRLAYIVGRGGWRFALRATTRARRRVFVDGQPGREYEADSVAQLTFSPDGHHLAYEVHKADKRGSFVVVNGEEGKPYDIVFANSLLFSDARTIVYVAGAGRKIYRVTVTLP